MQQPGVPDHDQRLKVLLQEFFEAFLLCFFADWAPRFEFTISNRLCILVVSAGKSSIRRLPSSPRMSDPLRQPFRKRAALCKISPFNLRKRVFQGPTAMPAYDAGFKIVARAAGREVATLAGVACDQWTPIVSEVQTTERLADRAFRAQRGRQRFVVYMEAYTYWTSAAPWSILSKSALLSERERLPTLSLVYILRPRGYRPQGGQFRLAVEETPTQQVWFREVCLWQAEPEPWWEEVPGLMALSPLCHQKTPPEKVVGHAAEAITAHTCDAIQRGNLLTTLGIFGKFAYPEVDVFQLIGRRQMQESKFY